MWLVVLGEGAWIYRGVRYDAGVHEVDDAVAAAARKSEVASLVVSSEPPELIDTGCPITKEDTQRAAAAMGVRLAPPAGSSEAEEESDAYAVAYDFVCPLCPPERPYAGPSQGALDRHQEFYHWGR